MIGTTRMIISKEQMIVMVEYYLNNDLLNTTFQPHHKVKVVDQIRKSGERFVITFEGEKAERPKTLSASDLSRPSTEAKGVAQNSGLPTDSSIAEAGTQRDATVSALPTTDESHGQAS